MECNKLMQETLDEIDAEQKIDNLSTIKDWIKNSHNIVNRYIKTGKDTRMDKFFATTIPTFNGTVSRIGMLDTKLANKIKVDDYVSNSFPFATSKNSEENAIFSNIIDERLAKHKDKIKVRFIINNDFVPQYDLSSINPAETEVLIKPKSSFYIDNIQANDDLTTIYLSSSRNKKGRRTIPLLSLASLPPLADKLKDDK